MLFEGLILLALLVVVAVPLACAIMLIIVLDCQKRQQSQLDNLEMTLRAVLRMTRRSGEGATPHSREEAVTRGSEYDVEAEEVTAPPRLPLKAPLLRVDRNETMINPISAFQASVRGLPQGVFR